MSDHLRREVRLAWIRTRDLLVGDVFRLEDDVATGSGSGWKIVEQIERLTPQVIVIECVGWESPAKGDQIHLEVWGDFLAEVQVPGGVVPNPSIRFTQG